MITGDDILELLKYGERISLECKDSRNEISKFVGKIDRKSTRLNSSHLEQSRMPSSA